MNIKTVLAIMLSMMATMAHAQGGIEFFSGTWQEALEQAKAENKPIFVDVYTTWCGPCKMMEENVFPLKNVGAKFNASFINYKLDAEKGEGITVAREFDVRAFPTYLFVNGEGVLCYRAGGSMPPEDFLQQADKALTECNDPKPLPMWEAEYASRKADKEFLLQYLKKRQNLGLDSGEILDQYASIASREEFLSKEVLTQLLRHQKARVDGPFYTFLFENKAEVAQAADIPAERMGQKLAMYAWNDVDRAIEKRDAQLMEKIAAASLVLPGRGLEETSWKADHIRMRFFSRTENEPELVKVLERYSRHVVNFDKEKIKAAEAAAAKDFEELVKTAPAGTPAEEIEKSRQFHIQQAAMVYSYRVRDIAGAALRAVNDKKMLNDALQWLEVAQTYSDNFTILETKAGLLHKLGRTAEAMQEQERSLAAFNAMKIPADNVRNRLTDNLEKMQAGKPTWIEVKTATSVPVPTGGQ